MYHGILRFLPDVRGVTMVEYGLITMLVAVFVAVVVGSIGTELSVIYSTVSTKV